MGEEGTPDLIFGHLATGWPSSSSNDSIGPQLIWFWLFGEVPIHFFLRKRRKKGKKEAKDENLVVGPVVCCSQKNASGAGWWLPQQRAIPGSVGRHQHPSGGNDTGESMLVSGRRH